MCWVQFGRSSKVTETFYTFACFNSSTDMTDLYNIVRIWSLENVLCAGKAIRCMHQFWSYFVIGINTQRYYRKSFYEISRICVYHVYFPYSAVQSTQTMLCVVIFSNCKVQLDTRVLDSFDVMLPSQEPKTASGKLKSDSKRISHKITLND